MRYLQKKETYYEVHMLLNNRIPGVAALHSASINGDLYLEYHDAGYRKFGEAENPAMLMRQLVRSGAALESRLKEYIISPDHIAVEADEILIDPETGKILFAVDPSREKTLQASLEALLTGVIQKMPHRDSRETDEIYRLLALSEEAPVTFEKLARSLQEHAGGKTAGEGPESSEAGLYRELGLSLSRPDEEDADDDDDKTVILAKPEPEATEEPPREEQVSKTEAFLLKAREIWKKYTFEICVLLVTLAAVILMIFL